MVIEGGVTSAVVEAYVEHILGPTLRPGQIVLLDKLSAHKSPRLRTLLAARGCRLWYLPSYSPDYSPIELAFAKLKSMLRCAAARVVGQLETTIAQCLDRFTSTECRNYFRHCGYSVR